MKRYLVYLEYEYDGYNGYEHKERSVKTVEATGPKDAKRKAESLLRPSATVTFTDVTELSKKTLEASEDRVNRH